MSLSHNLFDTHCHLDMLKMPLEEVFDQCSKSSIKLILTIATEPANLQKIIQLVDDYPQVYGTQGIHPHDAKTFSSEVENTLRQNIKHPKIQAVGEIGLDYYYMHSKKEVQIKTFYQQLDLAVECNMPVVIHSRDADEDMIRILKEYQNKKLKGVIHSFSSGPKLAETALELGLFLGINGMVTFKKAQNIRDIVITAPLKQLLLETDSPFLAPVPKRGKENGPYFLPFIGEKIRELKKIDESTFYQQLWKNSVDLFDIPIDT